MKSAYHILIISIAISLTYVWLKTPLLSAYSLQLFAIVVLAYFGIKKVHKAKVWQLLPTHASIEMAVVTLAFLLLIGATGNVRSVLFFLSFVHLFVLAIKSDSITAIVATMEIILFHFALTADPSLSELSFLLSLPIVMLFFLFAKDQYSKTIAQQHNLQKQQLQLLEAQLIDQKLENFMSGFLESKLEKLQRMSFFPRENQQKMQAEMAEIALITDELISQTKARENNVTELDAELEAELPEITEQITTTIDIFESNLTPTSQIADVAAQTSEMELNQDEPPYQEEQVHFETETNNDTTVSTEK